MAKLLGTSPNQVPTNADLGDLAYVDMDKIPTVNVGDGTLVTKDGNVGIGTNNPADNLDVNGAIVTTGGTTDQRGMFIAHQNNINSSWIGRSENGVANTDNRIKFNYSDDSISLDADGGERMRLTSTGVGIGTAVPTQKLDVNDDSIRVRTAKTPSSASDTGTTGQIAWDADYIYVCTATGTWKRVAIATW